MRKKKRTIIFPKTEERIPWICWRKPEDLNGLPLIINWNWQRRIVAFLIMFTVGAFLHFYKNVPIDAMIIVILNVYFVVICQYRDYSKLYQAKPEETPQKEVPWIEWRSSKEDPENPPGIYIRWNWQTKLLSLLILFSFCAGLHYFRDMPIEAIIIFGLQVYFVVFVKWTN